MANKFQNIVDFGGINNSVLPDKIPDRNCSYSNAIDFSTPGMFSTIGSLSTPTGVATVGDGGSVYGDAFVFKKSFGTVKEIMVRTYYNSGTVNLQWYNDNTSLNSGSGQWELMSLDGYTANVKYGFANANGDGGLAVNKLIIGNGVNHMMFWNGATSTVTGATSTTLSIAGTPAAEGFTLNAYGVANHILVNGYDFTYTGFTGTHGFSGVSPNPLTALTDGDIKLGDGVTNEINDRLMRESIYTSNTISIGTTGDIVGNYIQDTNATFISSGLFQLGQRVTVSGSSVSSNNKTYTIKTITETNLTLDDGELVTSEATGAAITISAGAPKGNILLVSQGKLFIAGIVGNESKYYYSITGDTTDFSISSGLASGGSVTLMDGGGLITALIEGNSNTTIIHKTNNIIAYSRSVDTSSNVIEKFDTIVFGYGAGAANSNSVTLYGKQHYYLNGNGEIKIMSQSLYSSSLWDIQDIASDIKDFMSDAMRVSTNQYLLYNPAKKCLVISTGSSDMSASISNNLVYVFIKSSANGYIYDTSIEKITSPALYQQMPILFFNSANRRNAMTVYFPYSRNQYFWIGDGQLLSRPQSALNGKAIYMSKEFTFGEIAQDKEFNMAVIDGFIYNTTYIKFTVLYGEYGEKGSKSYIINSSSTCVDQDVIRTKAYATLGEYSMPFLTSNYMIKNSRYFKLPLHIDVLKSDRYRIRIETYTTGTILQTGAWWAINNISTNVVLKDVDMESLLNQNETDGNGIGTAVITSENTGYTIS